MLTVTNSITGWTYENAHFTHITPKELQDYIAFFTTKEGMDIMPYVYRRSSATYDELTQSQQYYVCREEVENIETNMTFLSELLSGVTDIIEVGPGSRHPVMHKTIPIISCAHDLKCYNGVDYSEVYLETALDTVKQYAPYLKVRGVEADLLNGRVVVESNANAKKAILFFGITIGNFDVIQRNHVISQLAGLASTGDMLITTFDLNHDHETLINAYGNQYMQEFMSGVLHYLTDLCHDFNKYLNMFKFKTTWDGQKVAMYFEATEDLSFVLPGHGKIQVHRGQELRGVVAHKFTLESMSNLLLAHGFHVEQVLSVSDRVATAVCKKI